MYCIKYIQHINNKFNKIFYKLTKEIQKWISVNDWTCYITDLVIKFEIFESSLVHLFI